MMIWLNFLFLLLGLLLGGVINLLADVLPQRKRPSTLAATCIKCGHQFGVAHWLAVGRYLLGQRTCPACGKPIRARELRVEVGTAVLFAALPSLIPQPINLAVNSFYIAALILIIVIDLEHRLILDVMTYPLTGVALLLSMVVVDLENSIWLALLGAVIGFAIFYMFYLLGNVVFGAGALGFGDVKLAMLMGAMLGFHRIIFALMLAIFLGGIISIALLVARRMGRYSYAPYGQYLAIAAIVMLIWGVQFYQWYVA